MALLPDVGYKGERVDKAASFRYNCLVAFAKCAKGENNGRRKARCRDDGTARAGLNARVRFWRRHRGSPQEGRLHFKTRFCLGCGGVCGRFGQPLAVPLSRRKVRWRDVLALLCAAGGHVRLQPSRARDRDRAQDGQGRHRRVRFAQQKVQVVRLHLSRCADHHHSILQRHRRLGGALHRRVPRGQRSIAGRGGECGDFGGVFLVVHGKSVAAVGLFPHLRLGDDSCCSVRCTKGY